MDTQTAALMPEVDFTHDGATFRANQLPRLMQILQGFRMAGYPNKEGRYLTNPADTLRRQYNGLWDKYKANPGKWMKLYDIDDSVSVLALSLFWARQQIEETNNRGYTLGMYTEMFGADTGTRTFLSACWAA
jgi:hypothetical protein